MPSSCLWRLHPWRIGSNLESKSRIHLGPPSWLGLPGMTQHFEEARCCSIQPTEASSMLIASSGRRRSCLALPVGSYLVLDFSWQMLTNPVNLLTKSVILLTKSFFSWLLSTSRISCCVCIGDGVLGVGALRYRILVLLNLLLNPREHRSPESVVGSVDFIPELSPSPVVQAQLLQEKFTDFSYELRIFWNLHIVELDAGEQLAPGMFLSSGSVFVRPRILGNFWISSCWNLLSLSSHLSCC